MIWIFCPRPSDSARDLVNKINELGHSPAGTYRVAKRLKRGYVQTLARGRRVHPERGDLVVNWGCSVPAELLAEWNRVGARVLNSRITHNKYLQLVRLNEARVPVPPHATTRGTGRWLARSAEHHEANDLLRGLTHGDYYTMFLPSRQDLRVHILQGRSIRAGRKMPRRTNPPPHPEFRSWQAGWKLVYDGEVVRQKHRDASRRACEALGLDFGAVDLITLGDRPEYAPRGLYGSSGGYVVLEVNTAPGVEGNTLEIYARKFMEIASAHITR
jgi:glutathione synthase/RimK-type ligase-like ATP-grasp enzyme